MLSVASSFRVKAAFPLLFESSLVPSVLDVGLPVCEAAPMLDSDPASVDGSRRAPASIPFPRIVFATQEI